jgi:hypothetical protein
MNSSTEGNEKLVAVFDIGSGSVGGALVKFAPKSKPEILLTVRVPITLSSDLDFNIFLSETARSLGKVASNLDSAALGAPHEVHCFLSSPWYAAQTRIIKMSRNIPFLLTEKMVVELTCKEVSNFEQKNIERYRELGEDIRILEQEIMQVKLNGYKTVNPFGRKIKDFEAAMFISLSPEKVISELEYQIQKFFNREIKYHSFPFASFVVTRDLFPDESNFLFVDAAGEITDLTRVSDDILEESISFPYGKNFFIRSLSRKLGKGINEADSIFGIYLSQLADYGTTERLEKELAAPRQDWLKSFSESLHEICHDKAVSERIFLTADDDIGQWFKTLIEEDKLHQYTVTGGRFNVTILGSGIFQPYCQVSRNAEYDPFLILESIFINRI